MLNVDMAAFPVDRALRGTTVSASRLALVGARHLTYPLSLLLLESVAFPSP
jgi:hypothetical protein